MKNRKMICLLLALLLLISGLSGCRGGKEDEPPVQEPVQQEQEQAQTQAQTPEQPQEQTQAQPEEEEVPHLEIVGDGEVEIEFSEDVVFSGD